MVFSLPSSCFPRADDPLHHPIAFRERDQQQSPERRMPDNDFAKIVLGMPVVFEYDGQWIRRCIVRRAKTSLKGHHR